MLSMVQIECIVDRVIDADTLSCAGGRRVRLGGINAREKDGACRPGAPCPAMRDAQARPIVERLILRKRLTCQPVDMSYRRVVAACQLPDGRDLSCALARTGAVVWWPRYMAKYRMEVCSG
jgi:endonuclease YncB( thermonuclease family)